MKVTNILKDGTVVEDMSTVVVPPDKVSNIISIIEKKKGEKNEGFGTVCRNEKYRKSV